METPMIDGMKLEDFLRVALEPRPGQRKGQAFMNILCRARPLLYDLVHSRCDPFYKDGNLWGAVQLVRDYWDVMDIPPYE